MTRQFFLLALIAFIGCNRPSQEVKEVKVKPIVEHFSIPKLTNSQPYDSIYVAEAKWVTYHDPIFLGKYSFEKTTIDINPYKRSYASYDSLEAEMNYARRFSNSDTVDYNGFDLVVDYNKDVYYGTRDHIIREDTTVATYYAVYIVNSTNKTKLFNGVDGGALGIQEAKERWNKNVGYSSFRPIEHKQMKWCGMGDWKILVSPKEYVVLLFPKYKGTFRTEMRVRLQIGESTYVSKRFTGTVNEQQFTMHPFTIENIQKSGGASITDVFYGAMPDHHQWNKKKVTYRP